MDAHNQQDAKFLRMTTEKPEKLILRLSIPTIISMLITSFYNLADTFFVAKLENTSATGAIGVSFSLMAIIQAVGFFFGHGSGNYISRKLGSREVQDAERMAATGFFSAGIAGVLLAALGLVFLSPLATLLGSTDTIKPYAMDYLRYILLGAPYMCASLVLNNQLRFQSNAVFAMIGLTSGAVLNIALDPLFIFVMKMGVSGAALATIISQFVSFLLLLIGVQRSDSLTLRFSNFQPSLHYYRNILNGGTPSLCRQGLNSISTIVLNAASKPYGDAAIAAIGIVSRIMMFTVSALIGFGQGFQPVCGFNYGAGLYRRVRQAYLFCVKYATLFLLLLAVLVYAAAPWIVEQFQREDAQVIEIGSRALRAQAVTLPLMAWVILANMMTQTIGKVGKASVLAMSRQGLMFIPAVLLLTWLWQVDGLILAQPAADVLSFVLSIPLILPELRALSKDRDTLS